MVALFTDLLLICAALALVIDSVESLKCVKCESFHEPRCKAGDLEPTQCEEGDTHCVTYAAVHAELEGGFANRHCSKGNDSVGCHQSTVDGKTLEVCTILCQTDGCNSASQLHSSTGSSIQLAIITALCVFITQAASGNT